MFLPLRRYYEEGNFFNGLNYVILLDKGETKGQKNKRPPQNGMAFKKTVWRLVLILWFWKKRFPRELQFAILFIHGNQLHLNYLTFLQNLFYFFKPSVLNF